MAYKLHNPRILINVGQDSHLICPLMCGGLTKHVDHNWGGDLPNTQGVALIPC
jgi:hypothetical protein